MARIKPGADAPSTQDSPVSVVFVRVAVRAPHARRCRAGYCFDATAVVVSVGPEALAQLEGDPLLCVERVDEAAI